jgi:hypothetical protein
MLAFFKKARALALLLMAIASTLTYAQSGNSTSITGTVLDPSGAVVSNATVEIRNPVSGFSRSVITDAAGKFIDSDLLVIEHRDGDRK